MPKTYSSQATQAYAAACFKHFLCQKLEIIVGTSSITFVRRALAVKEAAELF